MSDQGMYRIVDGKGPRLRKRTAEQKRRTREKARQLQQEAVVSLSEFLPRPLSYAWEDGRRGKQRVWGNLIRHAEELVDSPTPPTCQQLMTMPRVLVWVIYDLCVERGIPVEMPEPLPPAPAVMLVKAA